MDEIWKNIPEYNGLYQVSNMGRVKSLNYKGTGKEKILKPATNKEGYLRVGLCKDGKRKRFRIHRLVAIHFIPNPNNLPEVNHIDENKTNNCVENLEWCDRVYNINHGTRTQRCSIPIVQLDPTTNKVIDAYPSTYEAERLGGFDHGNITFCCQGKRNTHGGYRWMYLKDYIANISPYIKVVNLFGKTYVVNK